MFGKIVRCENSKYNYSYFFRFNYTIASALQEIYRYLFNTMYVMEFSLYVGRI